MSKDYPVVVMSFNRPDYLEQVLLSIKAQNGVDFSRRPIFLMQDGAVSASSGKRYADDEDIRKSVEIFSKIFPSGTVMASPENLGVCKNFLRAESHVFQKLKADCAYFFEDDMVISPHYFAMLDRMAAFAMKENRIGYFGAYGSYTMPVAQQEAAKSGVQRLGHHWAFGLTRHHWLELHQWLEPYYEFVLGADYGQRPTPKILKYFRDKGLPLGVSSQDDTKKIGTYALNRASLNTVAVFARYIGERGVHMSADRFAERGYSKTEMFPTEIEHLDFPTDAQIDAMIKQEFDLRWRSIRKSEDTVTQQTKERAAAAMQALHGTNVYADFEPLPAADIQGWNGQHKSLAKLVEDIRPKLIVDIRLWKGQSTLFLARQLRENGIDGFVIGVDMFLGFPEQWRNPAGEPALPFKNGRPQLYELFLTNVLSQKLQDTVIPVALAPLDAARQLKRLGLRPNLVHLDAAKDAATVASEAEAYYDLLKGGGALVGDDYGWNHVAAAATEFARKIGRELEVDGPKWIIRKPAG